jgi:hypothetical protein
MSEWKHLFDVVMPVYEVVNPTVGDVLQVGLYVERDISTNEVISAYVSDGLGADRWSEKTVDAFRSRAAKSTDNSQSKALEVIGEQCSRPSYTIEELKQLKEVLK